MSNPDELPLSAEDAEALMAEHFPNGFPGQNRGRKASPQPIITAYRPLTIEDAREAQAHNDSGLTLGRDVTNSNIRHIRHTHHRLAQLLAGGMGEGLAGRLSNYSPSRVSILKSDPAFMELLALYKDKVDAEFEDFVKTAATLSMDFLQHLQQILDEQPEKITPALALEAIRTLADRSGNAPTTKSINLNLNTDVASRMRNAQLRLAQARAAEAIDADFTDVSDGQ